MKIKVIGKSHLQGTSKKTNRPYDFIQVHYNGKAFGVEGVAALNLSLDPKDYPYDGILIGAEYNVEFDNRGYIVEFSPAGKG